MFRAILLAAALVPFGAEAVTYQFAFEQYAAENLFILPDGDTYVANVSPSPNTYSQTDIAFGFTLDDLDDLTIDLTSIMTISPDAWAIGVNERSLVTFTGGTLTGWDLETYEGDGRMRHSSDPLSDFGWAGDQVANPEMLPSVHYGASVFAPSTFRFAMAPGRWICWADGQPCDASPDAQVAVNPVPASLLLLLSGIVGLGFVRFRSA